MDIVKLTIILVVYFATVKAAGPGMCAGQCFGTMQEYKTCTATARNLSCASSSFGASHCFVASGDYIDLSDQSKGTGAINGCIDCADKDKACEELKKAFRTQRNVDVTSCVIECCTTKMCNSGVDPPKPTAEKPTAEKPTAEKPTGHGFAATGSPFVLLAAFAVYLGF